MITGMDKPTHWKQTRYMENAQYQWQIRQFMTTKIVAISTEELEELVAKVVRKEMEVLYLNPQFGDAFSEEHWTRKQAASFLGISEQTLTILALEGKLVSQKSGRKWHFLKSSVLNYLKGR